jgi:hypothetical protein
MIAQAMTPQRATNWSLDTATPFTKYNIGISAMVI